MGIRYTRYIDRLCIRGYDLNVLYCLSDSDFAQCKDTANSTLTSEYIVLLNGDDDDAESEEQFQQGCCPPLPRRHSSK
jgi:hypothetical protein